VYMMGHFPSCDRCALSSGERLCPALGGWICPSCCDEADVSGLSCPSACPHLGHSLPRRQDAAAARLLADGCFLEQHLGLFGRIESALVRASVGHPVVDRHVKEALQIVIDRCRSRPLRPIRLPADALDPSLRLAAAILDSLPGAMPAAERIIACCLYILQSLEFHSQGTLEGRLYLEFVQEFFTS